MTRRAPRSGRPVRLRLRVPDRRMVCCEIRTQDPADRRFCSLCSGLVHRLERQQSVGVFARTRPRRLCPTILLPGVAHLGRVFRPGGPACRHRGAHHCQRICLGGNSGRIAGRLPGHRRTCRGQCGRHGRMHDPGARRHFRAILSEAVRQCTICEEATTCEMTLIGLGIATCRSLVSKPPRSGSYRS